MPLRTIPVAATPNQAFSVVLNERNVAVTLRTLRGLLYADVMCDGVPVCSAHICQDRQVFTERAQHLGFPWLRLCFADLLGTADPSWTELGARYVLLSVELTPEEEAALAQQILDSHTALVYDGSADFDGIGEFDGEA